MRGLYTSLYGSQRRSNGDVASGARVDVKEEAYKIIILVSTSIGTVCLLVLCMLMPSLLYGAATMSSTRQYDFKFCDVILSRF